MMLTGFCVFSGAYIRFYFKKKTVALEAGKAFLNVRLLLCVIRLLYWEKLLSHQEQANASYVVWVILCVIWCLDCKSVFTQEDGKGIISSMFSLLSP